jgi:Uma2 family endonuclease
MESAIIVYSAKPHWTDKELMALPNDGRKYELIEGRLLMSPVVENHGSLCMKLGALLWNHVTRRSLGKVYDSSTGFRLSPEIMLSPDISFVSNKRLEKILVSPDKFLQGAPDLVVEVLSPSDRMKHINLKLDQYFDHETRLAWLVDWKKQEVTIHAPDRVTKLSNLDQVLTGGEVLPAFRCKLSKIFSSSF